MKDIDGIYRVELLGPYGWERFSTAFIQGGEFRSASAEHFTAGRYQVEDNGFQMEGNQFRARSRFALLYLLPDTTRICKRLTP